MRFLIQKSLFGLAVAALIVGCGTDISGNSSEDPDPGSADFSTFVAIGDSLTAGYKDSALYRDGQKDSFPAILAQQFALAGGGAFTQPLMPVSATGSLTIAANPIPGTNDRLVLVPTGDPDRPAAPVAITPAVATEVGVPPLVGPFNNLGVPAAKSFHVLAANYGDPVGLGMMPPTANPFFVRFAGAVANSIEDDALAQAPTFFTLWLGNNDVLLYAIDGADPTVSNESITPPATFAGAFNILVGNLTAAPATRGVLINIPDVRSIPYFNTVPYNAIPLDQATADFINTQFTLYNLGVQSRVGMEITQVEADQRFISFSEGQNPVVILDKDLTDLTGVLGAAAVSMRQATPNDLVVLPASSKIGEDDGMGGTWGVSAPLLDRDVLTENEADEVEVARLAYNVTIKAAADADPNLAFFDVAGFLIELNENGFSYGSGGVSSTFAQGGAFSLDGIHPTARGYAVIANQIMQVIENAFGANLPPVDPNQYTTVFYQ